MKLFITKRSPYARKARIIALEKGIALEEVEEDLTKKSSQLIEANPLGKIPALVLDNGSVLVDNPVICEYLDSLNEKPILIPTRKEDRFKALHLAAVADGLMDVTVGLYMEKVRHPEDPNRVFVQAQEETIERTLKFFNTHVNDLKNLNLVSIAVASAIGYLVFRLPQLAPKEKYPQLFKWYDDFAQRPSMKKTMPTA